MLNLKSVWKWSLKGAASVALFCAIVMTPTAHADLLGGISGALSSVQGVVNGVSGILNGISSLFGGGGGGGGSAVMSAGVPNVPNGGVLPGPGNASYGISYVRDVFLPNITNWVVSLVLAGSVVVVIIGGIMFLYGAGNQETVDKARNTITWGVIGLVVTIMAYALVRIIITINYLG